MMQPQHKRHLAIGLLGAVLAPVIVLLTYLSISVPSWLMDDWLGSVILFVTCLIFSAVGALGCGLPFVLWLRAHERLRWVPILGGSSVAGALYVAGLGWLLSWGNQSFQLHQLGLGALLGLISGVGFCLGAGPNNSFKPKPLRGSA